VNSTEIRESFLSYFESKGCKRFPSSSLVPDDPSLLLTTAGMVQFKPVFLGTKDLGVTRATTVQKCVRTTDIDIIGTTGRHHSFFEMLGNFSFGDYFKSEACAWAYEYSVDVLGLEPDRIWYSIFEDDDEAEEIWAEEVGVPRERIVRMGAEDNFWSAGPTGPCGPCSELYYDQGPEVGCEDEDCAPGCDCDRYVEYWNLVFMQFDRQEDGELLPLPKKNIDTGMGLERLAAILQGVPSNFETDILKTLMDTAEELTGATYGSSEKASVSLRILADHSRAVTFLVADGVLPGNEGRGYVLRRLLRRAIRHGRMLGRTEPFMVAMIEKVIELMGDAYPEIVEHAELIRRIAESEEERFSATLRQGLAFLDEEIAALSSQDSTVLDGSKAFTLHDTYGFPVELTAEIAAENGLTIDMEAFEREMDAQRERARAAVQDESWDGLGSLYSEVLAEYGPTEFVGYQHDDAEAKVVALIVDGARVDSVDAGQQVEMVLDRTPFYGEQGGQVGDAGTVASPDGAVFEVQDTRIPEEGLTAHIGVVESGGFSVGEEAGATIDVMRRERIRRNHTATHLLHWALRLVLGDHVKQSGSLVAPDRFRFDFTHFEAPTHEQLEKIERMVNHKLMENHPVRAYETSLATAKESGVTALFGEKYGEFVRVLEVGNFSKELCGGTHVSRTTEIGLLRVISEGSVGANLRRIEAVTSFDALDYVAKEEQEILEAAEVLKVQKFDVSERVGTLVTKLKDMESAAARTKAAISDAAIATLLEQQVDVGYPLLVAAGGELLPKGMRGVADILRSRMGGGAVVLAGTDVESGKPLLIAAASDDAVAAGFDAGAVIKAAAPAIKGGGGGKPAMAQAGGSDASGIDEALRIAREMLGAE
jgi:alanyl-tRNA synthetase